MSRHRLYYHEPKDVRDALRAAHTKADEIHRLEAELIKMLTDIDRNHFFVRLGFRSLRPFLITWLKFSRTQAQRITTEVRRTQTTFDSEQQHHPLPVPAIERRLCASQMPPDKANAQDEDSDEGLESQSDTSTESDLVDKELNARLDEMTKYEIDHDKRENFRPTRPPVIVRFPK